MTIPRVLFIAVVLCACAIIAAGAGGAAAAADTGRTHIILVGATGDLAKRYLWPSLLKLHRKGHLGARVRIFGAATSAPDSARGGGALTKALDALADKECGGGGAKDGKATKKATKCRAQVAAFRALVSYAQLRGEDHYGALDARIKDELAALGGDGDGDDSVGVADAGRLFYLAIPPQFFGDAARAINARCRPAAGGGGWLRAVFEKPFGRDLESAEELSAGLTAHLAPREVLLIDHYLGKARKKIILHASWAKWQMAEMRTWQF